jgi:glyoxylate/hydroxypyruvate reductase A
MAILVVAAMSEAEFGGWEGALREVFAGDDLRIYPDVGDPAAIEVALVANPPQGVLGTLPNLRFIHSLWRGVDALVGDPTLPRDVPLARLVDPAMARSMTETVVLHVLTLHRRVPEYRAQQARALWRELDQPSAAERRVGLLGLGDLGRDAARALVGLGFAVAGWGRRPRELPGIALFTGAGGLAALLARTDILVNLLPLTDDTRGILDAAALSQLPAGASLINVARGGHVVEADLLRALDDSHLAHAILDVFAEEPLPADHPFWRHPRVTVLPHVAAYSDARSGAAIVAANVARFRAGEPVEHLVDWSAGY